MEALLLYLTRFLHANRFPLRSKTLWRYRRRRHSQTIFRFAGRPLQIPIDTTWLKYRLVNESKKNWSRVVSELSCADLENVIIEKLPPVDHNGEIVERAARDSIRIRMPYQPEYMGNDIWQNSGSGVFSGPKVMGLADSSMYVCLHAALGRNVVAVLSNLAGC
jgi:hypothetical protein